MSPIRYRDEGSSSGIILGAVVGALAGFAAGMYLAQNTGKRTAAEIGEADEEHTERLRGTRVASKELDEDFEDAAEFENAEYADDDEYESEDFDITLEERVLEAFRNDPILSTRAVDIGSLRTGVIELAGVVDTAQEAQHAVTIARGVPGVQSVVNRIVTGIHEPRYREESHGSRAGARDVERSVSESRPVRADMPEGSSSSTSNIRRADEPPRAGA
jgi:hypothetical protein